MSTFDDIYTYLLKRSFKSAATILDDIGGGQAEAQFTAVTASAPDSVGSVTVPTSSENNFLFFVNGQYIGHNHLTIQQSGSTLRLLLTTGSLGYSVSSSDEITAWGRFD